MVMVMSGPSLPRLMIVSTFSPDATRQLYFLGTNSQGIVTVYRGLPYRFVGVNLYETYYTSGLPAALIPKSRRSVILNHHLQSQADATKLVMNLETGNVTG